MTETVSSPEPAAGPPPPISRRQARFQALARLRHDLDPDNGRLGPGERAELRRIDPLAGAATASAPFWRFVVNELEPRGLLGEQAGDRQLRPYLAIVQAMASLEGLLRPKARLGAAMAAANVSEARLVRLLRARGDALLRNLRSVVHQLRSQAQAVDPMDLAELILSDGRPHGETVRSKIARAYYRQSDRPSQRSEA